MGYLGFTRQTLMTYAGFWKR